MAMEGITNPPKTEKTDIRFSTPASQHLSAAPPQDALPSPANAVNTLRPIESLYEGPRARDFEQAIIDDDSPGIDIQLPGPVFRSPRRQTALQARASRGSSPSSSERSSSPPDSIDAFAEPRRRARTNTVGSRHPSEFEELQRTVSGGTHCRRPAFDRHPANPSSIFVDNLRQSPEPTNVEENCHIPHIDYEALEEFVAENCRGRPLQPARKKYSFSAQGTSPYHSSPSAKPKITRQSPSPELVPNAKVSLDEKEAVRVSSEKTLALRPSRDQEDRFTFFSTEIDKAIHAPDLGGLLDSGERFRDLFELLAEEGTWWLDVTNPTKQELEVFEKAFGIHRLTTEDIGEKETREKVELFQTYYFVCFRSYNPDPKSEDYLEPINLYLVVFREGILSFAYSANPHAAGVRQRIGNRKDTESLTADWICYAMVDHIVDFYFPALRSIEMETDQIEDQVFVARLEDFSTLLRQIGECRKRVMTLMRLLGGKADVIKGFAKRCNAQYSVTPRVEIGLYLSDIQDHVVTMMSNLGHFEKMLSRSHANYLAQLSVDNLVQGNRANEALGKITFIASILVPMNLICGVFGMNVPLPGSVNTGNYAVFGGILASMGLIVLVAIVVGKRIKYI